MGQCWPHSSGYEEYSLQIPFFRDKVLDVETNVSWRHFRFELAEGN